MMRVPVRRAKGSMSFHLDQRIELHVDMGRVHRDMAKIQPGLILFGMGCSTTQPSGIPAIKAQPATHQKLVNPKPGMPKRFAIFDRLAQAALAKDMRFL